MEATILEEGGNNVDIVLLESIVQSPFVWSMLCLIAVAVYYRNNDKQLLRLQNLADAREKAITKLYEDHKKDSIKREEKLMNHLEKTTDTLEQIQHNLSNLETQIDGGFREVWDKIANLQENRPDNRN